MNPEREEILSGFDILLSALRTDLVGR
jgi:hypothetical protein